MGLYGITAWVTLARTRSVERLRLDHRDGTCVQLSATLERQGSLDAGQGRVDTRGYNCDRKNKMNGSDDSGGLGTTCAIRRRRGDRRHGERMYRSLHGAVLAGRNTKGRCIALTSMSVKAMEDGRHHINHVHRRQPCPSCLRAVNTC